MQYDQTKQETIKAVRHGTKDYLSHVASDSRLLARAAGLNLAALSAPLVADGLFAWWDALVNPADPGLAMIFSEGEMAALARYDAVIRGFHDFDPDKDMPLNQFVHTRTYRDIAAAACICYESLA